MTKRQNGASCIALVDTGKDNPHTPKCLLWPIILPIFASSPDYDKTKAFKERDPFVWGMETWSIKELRIG